MNSKKHAPNNNLVKIPTGNKVLELTNQIKKLEQKQRQICEMAARSILRALDLRDHYTYGHSMRVAYYSLLLGKEMNLSKDDLYKLELACIFHDIGKIGVPDSVLLKPSKLTDDEFNMMRSHPEKSAEILKGFEFFDDIAHITKHHHERFDGRGYPYNLKGEDIPLFSRMMLVADTFDAMTSSRPYRKGLPFEVAFQELRDFSGTQFDPKLIEIFIKAIENDHNKNENVFHLNIIKGGFNKKDAA